MASNPDPAFKGEVGSRGLFLDRDGVLNREIGDYVYRPDQFELLPGVPEALAKARAAGYRTIVVTNQGGVDRGIYTPADVQTIHDLIEAACPGLIDAWYYSPHHKTVTRSWLSKPGSVMIEKGLARFGLSPARSWIIGDAERDLVAGRGAGLRTVLVPTLKEQASEMADMVCTGGLPEAVESILRADGLI